MNVKSIKSRAHRILRHLSRYSSAESDLKKFADRIERPPDRELVGVYSNPLPAEVHAVVISSDGLHLILENGVTTVPYSAIDRVVGPTNKMDDRKILLQLKEGESIVVPILGGNDRFRDVFSFLRFLDRLLASAPPVTGR